MLKLAMSNPVLGALRALLLVAAIAFPSATPSQFVDTRTDWLYRGKIGLSTHYLARTPDTLEPLARQFQVEKVASQAASTGASWFLFTVHHQTWFMLAPNAAFDRILGAGNRTSERDVPLELHEQLSARNIRMMLYVILRMDPAARVPDDVVTAVGGCRYRLCPP